MSEALDKRFMRLAGKFDNAAYKQVKIGRGFTTIDAYHIVERLTEVFGLCGEGWGMTVADWREFDSGVACIGNLWYKSDDADSPVGTIEAVGDAAIIKGNVAEAYKKAQTNMMSKAASFIGVGLSVYQGKGIDDPYLDRAHETGAVIGDTPPAGSSGPVATDSDWQRIKEACETHGVSKDQLGALLKQNPFATGDNPRGLQAIHVTALLERVAESGEQP